jgi:hypothetical protein
MKIFGNLRGGCLKKKMGSGSDIEWISQCNRALIERFAYAVIKTVDSSLKVGTYIVDGQDQSVLNGAFDVGNALALERESFFHLMETEFLNGFDEVWFLDRRPDEAASALKVPNLMGLLDYGQDVVPPPPFTELYDLMIQQQAFLGICDGVRLECITFDAGVAAAIDRLYGTDTQSAG